MEQSTKAYEPGTVAEVTLRRKDSSEAPETYRAFWSAYEKAWVSAEGGRLTNNADFWDIDVRPLVVIDLDAIGFSRKEILRALRSPGLTASNQFIADAIEAQTKPPRIPEPESTGAIVKDSDRLWVKAGDGLWICLSDGQSGNRTSWPFLENPTLIREGLS